MPTYQQAEQMPQPTAIKTEGPRYRRSSSSHLAGPPLTYAQYPSANYSTPQMQQHPHFGGQFQSSYLAQTFPRVLQHPYSTVQQPVTQAEQHKFSPAISQQSSQYVTNQNRQDAELGDNSDGGVALPPNY